MVGSVERILLDTDIGFDVDDAYAMLYAMKSPDLSLDGITTVYGRTGVRAKIARRILDSADRSNVPVYAGIGVPMHLGLLGIYSTGLEGDGVLTPIDRAASLCDMHVGEDAPDFLIDQIMSRPGEYILSAIGPLTNIAAAFRREPCLPHALKQMYIMGGNICFPNDFTIGTTACPDPEYNFICDAQAAQEVLSADVPITLVPLDVTAKVPIDRRQLERLGTGHPGDEMVLAMTHAWFAHRDRVFQEYVPWTCMHDPLTLATINHPDLFRMTTVPLVVDDMGRTRIDKRGKPVMLCYDVDAAAFERHFWETMARPLPYAARR